MPAASVFTLLAADANVCPAFRATLGGSGDRAPVDAAVAQLDAQLSGRSPAPDPDKEAAAQVVLDELIDGDLYRFYLAKRELERRLTQVCRETRGTAAGAEALRLTHAVAGLFSTPGARPLLRAKTSAAKAADAAVSRATEAGLGLAYANDPDGFTVGD